MIITSVVEQHSDTGVLLMGEPVEPPPMARASRTLSEAMAQGVSKRFRARFLPSVQNPGKFQVEIDGAPAWLGEFDTQNEAMAFVRGFTYGFSIGGGIKNMADGLSSRLT
jgi:hypothetical protein